MNEAQTYGKNFDQAKLLAARDKTWRAVETIASEIKPGMRETAAEKLGQLVLRDMGARKFWHPVHIRFGINTTKGYRDGSESDVILKDEDVFFIDIGPIFDGHEGDCGKTYATGKNPLFHELASKSQTIYELVKADWQRDQLSGARLWERAKAHAKDQGVAMLPPYVKGHRISDFPHSLLSKRDLFDLQDTPLEERWILEIQIVDTNLGLGSFYEDILS